MRNKDVESDRVIIFDTTLRDGEQSPGASMSLDEQPKVVLHRPAYAKRELSL